MRVHRQILIHFICIFILDIIYSTYVIICEYVSNFDVPPPANICAVRNVKTASLALFSKHC